MSAIQFPKKNNLEWLRLFFAWQVVFVHMSEHFRIPIPEIIHHFPGVPAFFFVSGFLIYASYLNAPNRSYFENRFLRLFPGLLAVTTGGLIVLLVARGIGDLGNNFNTYLGWFIAQITLGQAYNPALFRDVGIGVINGSLWSITTEILFYLAVPFLVFLESRFRQTVLVATVFSLTVWAIGPEFLNATIYRDKTVFNVLELTPIVWGWMFGVGILAAANHERLQSISRYFYFLAIPLAYMIFEGNGVVFGSKGNNIGPIYFLCYVGLIYWIAFRTPYVRLPFDISYGTYIWHVPVINLLLVLNNPNPALLLSLTCCLAFLSWFLIEKPALSLKRRSIHAVVR
jgi:peptidoglycan/LPS O-acetylase OafA/YrhL